MERRRVLFCLTEVLKIPPLALFRLFSRDRIEHRWIRIGGTGRENQQDGWMADRGGHLEEPPGGSQRLLGSVMSS